MFVFVSVSANKTKKMFKVVGVLFVCCFHSWQEIVMFYFILVFVRYFEELHVNVFVRIVQPYPSILWNIVQLAPLPPPPPRARFENPEQSKVLGDTRSKSEHCLPCFMHALHFALTDSPVMTWCLTSRSNVQVCAWNNVRFYFGICMEHVESYFTVLCYNIVHLYHLIACKSFSTMSVLVLIFVRL